MKTRIGVQALYGAESGLQTLDSRPSPTEPREFQSAHLGLRSVADRLLSAKAVGAMTGDASKRKIRRWVDRGEFNSYALDGRTVYSEREIIAFVERVKARGPSRAPWRGNSGVVAGERPSNAPKQ